MAEESRCTTSLEFEIELDDKIENAFSIEIDMDLFILALVIQVLRWACCSEPDDSK